MVTGARMKRNALYTPRGVWRAIAGREIAILIVR
nr:MAG TPA: hypothetical protein [Caudoviricetes sp.]